MDFNEQNKGKPISFCSKVIGNGQCGTSLARAYLKAFRNTVVEGSVANLAVDNAEKLFDHDNILQLGVSGTGNDPEVGEKKARRDIEIIKNFFFNPYKNKAGILCEPRINEQDDKIVIFTSGGGGSGNGLTRVITELLVEKGKQILVVISTPRKSEGVKMKINNLDLINWFIKNCLKDPSVNGVNIALADNQVLQDRVGMMGGRTAFELINDAIIYPFRLFHTFTWKGSFDYYSGNNANIDISDIKRVLFDKSGGFLDFRRFVINDFESPVVDTKSLYFGSFDINTASNYLLALELPKKGDKRVLNKVAESVVRQVERKAKTPNSYSSYFYSSRIDKPVGHIIISGLRKSKAIEKLINSVRKDIGKLTKKQDADFEELELDDFKV